MRRRARVWRCDGERCSGIGRWRLGEAVTEIGDGSRGCLCRYLLASRREERGRGYLSAGDRGRPGRANGCV